MSGSTDHAHDGVTPISTTLSYECVTEMTLIGSVLAIVAAVPAATVFLDVQQLLFFAFELMPSGLLGNRFLSSVLVTSTTGLRAAAGIFLTISALRAFRNGRLSAVRIGCLVLASANVIAGAAMMINQWLLSARLVMGAFDVWFTVQIVAANAGCAIVPLVAFVILRRLDPG